MLILLFFFFFHDTATTDIYTLSLHDALPISFILIMSSVTMVLAVEAGHRMDRPAVEKWMLWTLLGDRKSTRLNSSHRCISYAVFCLKKKTPMTLSYP